MKTGEIGVCKCGDHATGYCSDKDAGDYCDSVNSRCLCGEGGEQCQEADQACRNSTCVGKTLTSSNRFAIACLLDNLLKYSSNYSIVFQSRYITICLNISEKSLKNI